jgi:hypothetical protein
MNARLRALASFRAGLVAAELLAVAAAAHAQVPLQPGLWEETMSTKSDNPQANAAMAQMQEKLAAMPPEQRKMVEQMMAAHGVGAGSASNSLRVCLTKEQIARDFVPDGNNGRCSHKRIDQSGNTTRFSFTCEGKNPVSGQGVFTQVDSKSFTVATDTDMLMQGKPSHMHADLAGHFLGSDCGDVKPVTPPAR